VHRGAQHAAGRYTLRDRETIEMLIVGRENDGVSAFG
jgi:hypothetical protein